MHIPSIPPFDQAAADLARERQGQLTKPAGALGRLEALSIQLAGMTGRMQPDFARRAVILMAADHGVALEGVSAYPPAVTVQMLANIANGGAAVNVLARQQGARVVAVDVGVAADTSVLPGVLQRKLAAGSANLRYGPAMSRALAEAAIQTGMQVLAEQAAKGLDLVALGEMGIGNTTAAASLGVALTGASVDTMTGRGTGLDDAGLAHKVSVIEEALAVNAPDPHDPLDALAKLGGLDIAALAGVVLAAAARRIPVLVDGFISAAAALIAVRLAPEAQNYLIASHLSVERGHAILCEALGLEPLLDLQLRLGEGSGAVLAMPLVESAARILAEMSTFAEAGVSRHV
ncbi:MAG: nicotinate-nucleotide--dimethylbenzimidazole phosphoribosyltransferase [Chloroflexota bacterium]|nr:nicotinate-nucleotide--dimethylbenzimidazole phosphoribosyltransferase [Chloroflexota bacterium]